MEQQSHIANKDPNQSQKISAGRHGGPQVDVGSVPTTILPRKGILKVRFADDSDQQARLKKGSSPEKTAERQSQPRPAMTRCQGDALLIPQPPPPAPPPQPLRPQHLGPPPPTDAPLPPSLFDPTIASRPYLSGAAYELYTKFIEGLSQFVDYQAQLVRKRLAIQEKRVELRRLREEVSQSDVMLMNHIRRNATEDYPFEAETLTRLFEEAQSARDKCGPFEAEYELLELKLGAEEDALAGKYTDLEKRYDHFFRLREASTMGSEPSEVEIEYEESSSASSAHEHESRTPEAADLLYGTIIGEEIMVGQLPIFAQRKRTEVSPITHVFQAHKRLGQQSDVSDFALDHQSPGLEYDQSLMEYPEELLGISGARDVDVGVAHWSEYGLPEHKVSPKERLRDLSGGNVFAGLIDPGPLPEDMITDPRLDDVTSLLLFRDGDETMSELHGYLMDFNSTPERINNWLLHQLRLSRRETFALRGWVQKLDVVMPDWPTTSLELWSSDELGYSQPYIHGSVEDYSEYDALIAW